MKDNLLLFLFFSQRKLDSEHQSYLLRVVAVLSLFVNGLVKVVNRKGKLKSSLIFDEFPTIYLNGIDSLIATARSNKVATTLGIQDLSQLRKDCGKEQADVIMGIIGNIISGQVTGDTAKQLSECIGKIMQDRQSLSIKTSHTSISKSKQLETVVPPSKIAGLSSGEFVGLVADDLTNKIALKTFHCEILNNHDVPPRPKRNPIKQSRKCARSLRLWCSGITTRYARTCRMQRWKGLGMILR